MALWSIWIGILQEVLRNRSIHFWCFVLYEIPIHFQTGPNIEKAWFLQLPLGPASIMIHEAYLFVSINLFFNICIYTDHLIIFLHVRNKWSSKQENPDRNGLALPATFTIFQPHELLRWHACCKLIFYNDVPSFDITSQQMLMKHIKAFSQREALPHCHSKRKRKYRVQNIRRVQKHGRIAT